jgi:glutaredoxin
LTFTVYSRQRCGCCEKALVVLKEYQARFGFALREVDIDRDRELAAKYDTEVPVVAVNGKVRFRGVVNRALLERLLLAEGDERSGRSGNRSQGR